MTLLCDDRVLVRRLPAAALGTGLVNAACAWWTCSWTVGPGPAWGIAAAWGLAAGMFQLRAALRLHRDAHSREARRLGYRVQDAGGRNPVRWWTQGLPLAVEARTPGGSLSRLDRALIEIAGPWANLRSLGLHLGGTRIFLCAILILLCANLLVIPAIGPNRFAASFLGGLGCLGAFLLCSMALNLLAAGWSSGESGSYQYGNLLAGDFRHWPFLGHEEQRAAREQREVIRRATRRICRSGGRLRPGRRILELGAGGGTLWALLPEALRRDWTSTDIDPVALRWGHSIGRGPRAVCADALKLPFPPGSFDSIVGLTFFDGMSPGLLPAVLGECRRVLRPGGRLLHMQDFQDWPAPELAGQWNALLDRFPRRPGRITSRDGVLQFPFLDGPDGKALRERASALEPHLPREHGDRLAFMAQAMTDPEFARRFQRGPLAFLWILERTLRRSGFVAVSGLEEETEPFRPVYHLAAVRSDD